MKFWEEGAQGTETVKSVVEWETLQSSIAALKSHVIMRKQKKSCRKGTSHPSVYL